MKKTAIIAGSAISSFLLGTAGLSSAVFAATSTQNGYTETVIVGAPATNNSNETTTKTASPNVVIGVAGYEFDNYVTQAQNVFVEKSHTWVNYNTSGTPVPFTWTGSESVSASASASGSLGGGWGPINASIGYNVNTSVSQSYTLESSLTIPAHWYGWYDFGYANSQWYGDYAYVDQYGNHTSDEYITVKSPRYNEMVERTSATSPTNP